LRPFCKKVAQVENALRQTKIRFGRPVAWRSVRLTESQLYWLLLSFASLSIPRIAELPNLGGYISQVHRLSGTVQHTVCLSTYITWYPIQMKGKIHLMHLFRILFASSGVGSSTWIWEKSLYDSSAYCVGTFGSWKAATEVTEAEATILGSSSSLPPLPPAESILLSNPEDISKLCQR
jgi:hypothetical protein